MNSHRYLGMALGASMSLCAPTLASAATLTINDLTDTVSFSFSGFTSPGSITSGESGRFTGSYTSATPPTDIAIRFYNITGPGETLSDTLSITVAPTGPGVNTSVTVDFFSNVEGGAALTPLSCTTVFPTACISASIAETGASQTVNAGLADLIVSFASDVEVPLPAALPLFASGLGALGLLGWRRKRKAAALTA
jgi:uncharacterized protein YndB with AHSA1/START domain